MNPSKVVVKPITPLTAIPTKPPAAPSDWNIVNKFPAATFPIQEWINAAIEPDAIPVAVNPAIGIPAPNVARPKKAIKRIACCNMWHNPF